MVWGLIFFNGYLGLVSSGVRQAREVCSRRRRPQWFWSGRASSEQGVRTRLRAPHPARPGSPAAPRGVNERLAGGRGRRAHCGMALSLPGNRPDATKKKKRSPLKQNSAENSRERESREAEARGRPRREEAGTSAAPLEGPPRVPEGGSGQGRGSARGPQGRRWGWGSARVGHPAGQGRVLPHLPRGSLPQGAGGQHCRAPAPTACQPLPGGDLGGDWGAQAVD